MSKVMNMPKIGVNMTEATIVEWVVEEGDTVGEGDHILSAETDKAVQEIYATVSGVLAKKLAAEGETVATQTPVAVFAETGESVKEAVSHMTGGASMTETAGKEATRAADRQSSSHTVESASPSSGRKETEGEKETEGVTAHPRQSPASRPDRIRISPLAKKIAKHNGIPLQNLSPSVPGKRITKADVLRYIDSKSDQEKETIDGTSSTTLGPLQHSKPSPVFQPGRTVPFSKLRSITAERMISSVRSTARAFLTLKVDAGNLVSWRDMLTDGETKVSYTVLIAAAVASALKAHPIMNSRLEKDRIVLLPEKNIGIAVETNDGLVVAVIKNMDRRGVLEANREFLDIVERLKSGNRRQEDITEGTFTISNLGHIGIDSFVPIINPPETGILGIGRIQKIPSVTEDDSIEIRPIMELSLSFDHQVVDGAPAGRFLYTVKELLENPLNMLS